jgi:hypothetical protein
VALSTMERTTLQKLFAPLLAISLVLALLPVARLSMGGPILYPFLLALPWIVCALAAAVMYRWRGLWFLVGAPFALGPALLLTIYLALCIPAKSCL